LSENHWYQGYSIKEEKFMTTNGESKFSYLLVGLGLGAVGGLMAAVLARKETRELLRERSGKSLDYLNQQAGKLRETADVIVQQGKKLIACESVDHSTDDRRENLGG
jgi:gas vesicle protein